jgi:uncharacterized phiE125 gp8 family phage protein
VNTAIAVSRPTRVDPDVAPVTLAEVKTRLRITDADAAEDADLETMIRAAWDWAEMFMERTLLPSTFTARYRVACVPTGSYYSGRGQTFEIPRPPLVSVESVTGEATDGSAVAIDLDDVEVDTLIEPGTIRLPDDVAVARLTVEFTAGYATPAEIPEAIREGLFLAVGSFFEVREDQTSEVRTVAAIPQGARDYWNPLRIVTLA